ncbi:MAG: copper resistance CopC family protein, partial [Chloroflexota bacterium]
MNRSYLTAAFVLLLTFGLLLLGPARPARAHAAFSHSDPAPGSVLPEHTHQVTIWFTEPLEPEFSEIQVLNTEGQQVDNGNSEVLPDDETAMTVSLPTLPDGTYTVVWRNVSTVDGHSLRGSFVLSFGEALPGAAA